MLCHESINSFRLESMSFLLDFAELIIEVTINVILEFWEFTL